METIPNRPNALPRNYPPVPANFPHALFRLQLAAAKRYLFESELKELLEDSQIPLIILDPGGHTTWLTEAHCAYFAQGLKLIAGEDKALAYGRDAFESGAGLMARISNTTPSLRNMSSADRRFKRIKESLPTLNHTIGMNVLVKWHGGAEFDLFEDTGQHCYAFMADQPICQTMTGFFEAAILYLAGVKVMLSEVECMAKGSLSCRWHCLLA